jgi:hypothetical protein
VRGILFLAEKLSVSQEEPAPLHWLVRQLFRQMVTTVVYRVKREMPYCANLNLPVQL